MVAIFCKILRIDVTSSFIIFHPLESLRDKKLRDIFCKKITFSFCSKCCKGLTFFYSRIFGSYKYRARYNLVAVPWKRRQSAIWQIGSFSNGSDTFSLFVLQFLTLVFFNLHFLFLIFTFTFQFLIFTFSTSIFHFHFVHISLLIFMIWQIGTFTHW